MNTTCKIDDIINKLEGDFYNNFPQNVLLYLKEFKNQSRQLQETREQLKQANEKINRIEPLLHQLRHDKKPDQIGEISTLLWEDLPDMIGEPVWVVNLINGWGEWHLISKADDKFICLIDKYGVEDNAEKELYNKNFIIKGRRACIV